MLLAVACRTSRPSEQPPLRPSVVDVQKPGPPPQSGLYSAQEALRDVLSGELEYIGTGRWPGVERSRACAFRNQRVVVVNAYCTLNEAQAFRIEVYSPTRGRVRSCRIERRVASRRGDYSHLGREQLPPDRSEHSPLTLAMPSEQMRTTSSSAMTRSCRLLRRRADDGRWAAAWTRRSAHGMDRAEPIVSRSRERRLVSRDPSDALARHPLRRESGRLRARGIRDSNLALGCNLGDAALTLAYHRTDSNGGAYPCCDTGLPVAPYVSATSPQTLNATSVDQVIMVTACAPGSPGNCDSVNRSNLVNIPIQAAP